MNGEWKYYYQNGKLKESVHFKNNVEDGIFVEYHENGNKKDKGTYSVNTGFDAVPEIHHSVEITDTAIVAGGNLSHRYISDRQLADKAIDLIDESASRVRMYRVPQPADIREAYDTLRDIRTVKTRRRGAPRAFLASLCGR